MKSKADSLLILKKSHLHCTTGRLAEAVSQQLLHYARFSVFFVQFSTNQPHSVNNAEPAPVTAQQACNELGKPGGAKSFLRRAQIF